MDYITYDCIAYVRADTDENTTDAAMCYLSYYLSEDIQTEMYITNEGVLPMEKNALMTFLNEKYPSAGWVADFLK